MTTLSDRLPKLAILAAALLSSSGCGLLLGNVKPVAQKSQDYEVLDLRRLDADWIRLPPAEERQAATLEDPEGTGISAGDDVSDVSFQSERTASIISASSTCRPRTAATPQDEQRLREYMSQLLLGFSDVQRREEKEVRIGEIPAFQATIEGRMSDRPMAIRAVVVQRRECIYDLMFIARPEHFSRQENDFSKFVGSFRLK